MEGPQLVAADCGKGIKSVVGELVAGHKFDRKLQCENKRGESLKKRRVQASTRRAYAIAGHTKHDICFMYCSMTVPGLQLIGC